MNIKRVNRVTGVASQETNNKVKEGKTSLWASPELVTYLPRKKGGCTYSLCFNSKYTRGSMTVEAALAVPLFLFFVANLLSLLIMYESYSKSLADLHQKAKIAALAAHLSEGGSNMLELSHPLIIIPLFDQIGYHKSVAEVTVKVRKWTGYDVLGYGDDIAAEEYVYITDSGSVYHRSRDCSHLRISISVVTGEEISQLRNASGHKYYPCEQCHGQSNSGLVFITSQGDRYHAASDCSSLKRRIKTVKLSEVGDKGPCSECG